ncbi:MAG: response regulator transcription factor [Provencibacterium sp.]|nr:response regulator transcription factor [Provencibacterium sp.]
MKLLLVEDDAVLCDALAAHFKRAGYEFDCCGDGETGCYYALQNAYDCILLDRMLPKMDGLRVLESIRKKGIAVPVLLLTALGALGDRVNGLDAGADDYLVKPFEPEELLARIRALIRRPARMQAGEQLHAGDLSYFPAERRLCGPAGESILSKTEGLLFETLCRNRGQLLPRELLYLRVWGPEAETEEQGVDNYIHFLRRRLRTLQSGCRIVTVRSLGYRLEEKEC